MNTNWFTTEVAQTFLKMVSRCNTDWPSCNIYCPWLHHWILVVSPAPSGMTVMAIAEGTTSF